MTAILVVGAGPAAVISAILLRRMGHRVQVIGRVRRHSLMEGASPRVAEGLARVQCRNALAVLGPRWQRVAAWGGEYREVNGEHVIDRHRLDRALTMDLLAADVGFIEGRVLQLGKVPDGWWGVAELASGERIDLSAQFLVEARGRSASKLLPDVFSGPMGVALTRHFQGRESDHPLTLTEPFDEGWAWATVDANGSCSIQLVLDHGALDSYRGQALETVHGRLCQRLRMIPERLGALVPKGAIQSRGIQPVLRGGLVDDAQLRVGDAAYSCDPLSGHGMYEAISGAFAAAPTINTLLCRRDLADLACRFYRERAATLFHQRLSTAAEFYRSEPRWMEQPFWCNRREQAQDAIHVHPAQVARVVATAVVEDGLIVERKILVTADNPRGIRFVAGVDLVQLLEARKAISGEPSVMQLAQRLSAAPERIAAALAWLRQVPEVAL